MKFSLWRYSVELRKKSYSTLRQEDMDYLNDRTIEALRNFSESDLNDRLDSVTVKEINSTEGIREAKETLSKEGIVVVPGFVSEDFAKDVATKVYEVSDRYMAFVDEGDCYEDELALAQFGAERVSGYSNLAAYKKPVVQVRSGQDKGMVDIFNADKLIDPKTDGQFYKSPFYMDSVRSIIKNGKESLEPANLNVYINKSIDKTRGFHVDSYSEQIKAFVYLTDVSGLDDGPYTYVKGSHVDSSLRRVNKALSERFENRTEAPIVPLEAVVPVVARKGSLVISDQSGVHRGFPQSSYGFRMVAVMNFRPA